MEEIVKIMSIIQNKHLNAWLQMLIIMKKVYRRQSIVALNVIKILMRYNLRYNDKPLYT